MKLEYLPDGAPECPLLRLYDFSAAEASLFYKAIRELMQSTRPLPLHVLPFVSSVSNCRLTLEVGNRDQGIMGDPVAQEFVCRLTTGCWEDVAGLVEPFERSATGYQWLDYHFLSDYQWLLSVTGQW